MGDLTNSLEPYVFLSYASPDRERAVALADSLERAGLRVWLDRRSLVGGSSWDAAIVRAIKDSTVFAVLCSAASIVSPNVTQELRLAWEERRPLLPLLLESVRFPDEMRYILTGRQWVELLDRPEDDSRRDLLRALAEFGLTPAPRAAIDPAAAAAPPARRKSLPVPLTSFIGREREVADATALLVNSRLLTLTGPGGTGKTRLALEVARRRADAFPDGVWFVDLSSVADAAGVVPAIAQVLEVRESDGRSLAVSLAAYLRSKRLLLVLDNFEQVVQAAMSVHDLLLEAPGLTVLVTSRILLRVGGEQEYAVSPLPLPKISNSAESATLSDNPAVQLFVERARALRPEIALTSETAVAVAEICRRLDGLPLAIELAAARVKLLPPAAMLARLDHRLSLLTGGVRSLPERQQTLRATIAWSWDLLSEPEQVLFRRLAVFAGGWNLEAAEAVCNSDGALDVLEGLASLVDKSLMRQTEVDGEPRFSMLATLREFALEQLEASGETAALLQRHAGYFSSVAEQSLAACWRSGRVQHDVLRPLDPVRENLLAALRWTVEQEDAALGLRLAGALQWWFFFRAPGEGRHWLELLFGLSGAAEATQSRGIALFTAAFCTAPLGDSPATLGYLEAAAALFRVLEDLPWLSRVLACQAFFLPASAVGRAQALAEEALMLARSSGEPCTMAYVQLFAGNFQSSVRRDAASARALYEEALRLARALDADWITQAVLSGLAAVSLQLRRPDEARGLWREARAECVALGDRLNAATLSMNLALQASAAGDNARAAMEWRVALALSRDPGNTTLTATSLVGIADLLAGGAQPGAGARLLGAVDSYVHHDEAYDHAWRGGDKVYNRALAATRAALDEETFERTWADGRALSLDQAVAEALQATAPSSEASGRAGTPQA